MLSRLGVRRMSGLPAFPSVLSLGSTGSALGRPSLFVGFTATTGRSDFSGSCIIGFGSSPSRCGPFRTAKGQAGDLPVPVHGACVRARFCDPAGPPVRLR